MLEPTSFTIDASARLHFGLWAWGCAGEREFGGVGMMVRQPELTVRFSSSPSFEATGQLASRSMAVARRCGENWGLASLPNCKIEVLTAPIHHAGFGLGTQLSLSIAAGLAHWTNRKRFTPAELATASGRGLRSAIGTHGFGCGGLIVDAGKHKQESIGELADRVEVPSAWRVLLVTPNTGSGKQGKQEREAFANLPPVNRQTTQKLKRLAFEQIVPACQAKDFPRFAENIYEYGRQAGECFASVQGGPYCDPVTASMVEQLRQMGVRGVGQSSWGPTLFGFVPNESAATALLPQIQEHWDKTRYRITLTGACNQGAAIQTQGEDPQPVAVGVNR